MYHSYFGLDEQAFSIAVNPRYLYMSTQHKEALAHLLYGVSSGGFVMLSGEVGTGKTTIIRCLLGQLPDTADVAFVMNPSASAPDLLCSICDEFGVGYEAGERSLKILTDGLTDFLLRNHSQQRKSIILIDEAQLLKVSTLEQVRLLTNLETNTEKLLQIILVGQPELNELLARPALRQLSQRITARYHLRPLSEAETEAYIKHRLSIGGLPENRNPFPPKILAKIHRISRGIPRLVNVLCDRMLLGVYSKGATVVDNTICNQAIVEVLGQGDVKSVKASPNMLYAGFGVMGLLFAFVLWLLLGTGLLSSRDGVQNVNGKVAAVIDRQLAPSATSTSGVVTIGDYWSVSQDSAMVSLVDLLDIDFIESGYPCWSIEKLSYHCETRRAENWPAFFEINRPAVLTITTPGKQIGYVTFVGLVGRKAQVSIDGELKYIDLSALGNLWTGEYVFVWYKPASYKDVVGKGSRGAMVTWIAQQFAVLDKQTKPITENVFTEQLKRRVEIFQRKHKLADDGVVGLQTLLKLNEELGFDKSLDDLSLELRQGN